MKTLFRVSFLFKNLNFGFLLILVLSQTLQGQSMDSTYAEKLGFPKGSRVLILHVDDAGMSYDSNLGAEEALTKGISTSVSVMMPCPWVTGFIKFLKEHKNIDAGIHLTLTSEWDNYRWAPLTGKTQSPGLYDPNGYFWPSAEEVVAHSNPQEVDLEIRAQLEKARNMGFEPSHLDSHMGTLFDNPAFLMKYIQLGIENHIPIMLPGGHDQLIAEETHAPMERIQALQSLGKLVWSKGLPVLDDLHNISYDWIIPMDAKNDFEKLREFKTKKYKEAFKSLKSGITMMIMHCTKTSPYFQYISSSGPTREGDLLAMLDPILKKTIQEEGIILTTWKEIRQRRNSRKN